MRTTAPAAHAHPSVAPLATARPCGTAAAAPAAALPAASPSAPGAGSTFSAAWVRSVAEVDDATLVSLLRHLIQLRRMKFGIAGLAFAMGAVMFGRLSVANPVYALLMYGTLGCVAALPALAVGGLTVRSLFLREAARLGLSRSTSLLLLTRAERRDRFVHPLQPTEPRVSRLMGAVREWDQA